MSDHARFAPSSAHRWLYCSGSVDAASRYPDPPTEAKMEGTAMHFLEEQCLISGQQPAQHLGRAIVVREQNVERRFVVDRDMARDVGVCVDASREIASHPGVSRVESRVDLSHIEPGTFGTCDLWHWGRDGILTIKDSKYGRLDVAAERNEQEMLYASGVYEEIKRMPDPPFPELPGQVTLVVAQPRSVAATPRVKRWSFAASELEDLSDRAFDAITEANRFPKFSPGPWCRHCPALGDCPATSDHRELATSLMSADMTVADASRILRKKDLLEKVVERAEKVMLDALLAGHRDENHPLVTKVKHRQWRDVDLARQRVAEDLGPDKLEPPSPAQTEKLGAAGRKIAQELSFTPPGEPAVGKYGDKRAPYLPKSPEAMFGPAQ